MKKRYSIILLLILSHCFSAFTKIHPQFARTSRTESSVSSLGESKWRISLSPKDRWFYTNINVTKGSTINISATGFVTWAPPGGRNMSPRVGPNGTRPPFAEDKNRFPMPEAGCGSLIMRVADSKYFVGEGGAIKVNESGIIQLMINDDVLSDNSGGFSVDIEIPQNRNQNKSNHLVFSSQKDGNQEVYLLDLTTGGATNLSQSSEDDGYPRCSSDGRKIAFATNRDGYWEIYLMNRAGNGQSNLTRNRGGNGYMDWSPDGQTLVFASTRNGEKNNELYIVRADGTGLKRLTNNPAEDVHPDWSPDGKKIAFASERDGNRQIYVMNADGANLIRLMSNRWYDDYPAWSPDGSQLAFASDRDTRTSERLDIYVASRDGLNIRRIVSNPADDRHPSWSPDGGLVAFASNRDGDRDIFIVRADGTGLKKVFSADGNDEHPQWCGNGQIRKRIEVQANKMWVDTGIDTTGRVVRIEYESGRWSNGGNMPLYADGRGGGSWRGLLVPNAPFRSLVGKTSSGTFYVGNLREGNFGPGRLYLSINDVPGTYNDNLGSLIVVVNSID